MLRNIHFGGAVSGSASIFFSQSMVRIFGPNEPGQHTYPSEYCCEHEDFLHGPILIPADTPRAEAKVPHVKSPRPCWDLDTRTPENRG